MNDTRLPATVADLDDARTKLADIIEEKCAPIGESAFEKAMRDAEFACLEQARRHIDAAITLVNQVAAVTL